MKLTPITAWRIVHGLSLFMSGQSSTFFLAKIKPEAFAKHFERRSCEFFCKKFPDSDDFLLFCIAAFAYNREMSLTDMESCYDYYKEKYHHWMIRRARPQYYFQKDLDDIFETLERLHMTYSDWLYGGSAVSWYMDSRLHIDTFILLDRITNFLTHSDSSLYNKLYKTFTDAYGKLALKENKYDLNTYKQLYIKLIQSKKSIKREKLWHSI